MGCANSKNAEKRKDSSKKQKGHKKDNRRKDQKHKKDKKVGSKLPSSSDHGKRAAEAKQDMQPADQPQQPDEPQQHQQPTEQEQRDIVPEPVAVDVDYQETEDGSTGSLTSSTSPLVEDAGVLAYLVEAKGPLDSSNNPLQEHLSSSTSSTSLSVVPPHTKPPTQAEMINARAFTKGDVLVWSTVSKDDAESTAKSNTEFNRNGSNRIVPPSVDKPGTISLLDALMQSCTANHDQSLAQLLLSTEQKLSAGGSALKPQLSGMMDEDLSQVPADLFDNPTGSGRALLMGVESFGDAGHGRTNAVRELKKVRFLLAHCGWSTTTPQMRILTDNPSFSNCSVSHRNIISHFEWLMEGAKAGDKLLFIFCGACSAIPMDVDGSLVTAGGTGRPQRTLLPQDFLLRRQVKEIIIRKGLRTSLPKGVQLQVIFDFVNSGTGVELPLTLPFTPEVEFIVQAAVNDDKAGVYFAPNPQFS